MSTKIGNGWRLKLATDPLDLPGELLRALEPAARKAQLHLAVELAQMLERGVEPERMFSLAVATRWTPSLDPEGMSRFAVIERIAHDLNAASAGGLLPFRDFIEPATCEVIVLRDGLLLMYAENRGYERALRKIATPYPYWSNTDRPSGVTAAEWDERRRAWDAALSGNGIPSECGLSFSLGALRLMSAAPLLEQLAGALAKGEGRLAGAAGRSAQEWADWLEAPAC